MKITIKEILILAVLSLFSLQMMAQCQDCTSLEEALKDPAQVKSLKINPWQHEITLDVIPPEIGELINIEILFLSDHNFSEVPAEIGKLSNLKELSFAGCQLESLPKEIYQLTNLKEVILLNNNFSNDTKKAIKERFKEELPKTHLLIN